MTVRRGGVLSLVFPIPPATVSFHGKRGVRGGSPEARSRSPQLGAMLPDERRDSACLIEIAPDGDFLTYGVDMPLRKMRDPAIARARVRANGAMNSARSQSPTGIGSPADQAGLIAEHHGLHAVAQSELRQDPVDVRLDRRLAHDQPCGDLAVREPAGDQLEHLQFARGQVVQPRGGAGSGRRPAYVVLDQAAGDPGDSSASPDVTSRTASISRAGGRALEQEATGPAFSAS